MNIIFRKVAMAILSIGSISTASLAQVTSEVDIVGKDDPRPITTAVPFLTISPDARSGALGDAGVAISPDANSAHWNISKLAFLENKFGVGISYTPWLRKLVGDMSISFLSGYYKPTKERAFAFSLTYFDMGDLDFIDAQQQPIQTFKPKEYAPKISYAQKLSSNLSIGGGIKLIYSNLSGSINVSNTNGASNKPGVAGAVDVGIYYTKDLLVGGKNSNLSLGANISDVGTKISYTTTERGNFIPTNLRLGAAYSVEVDQFNKFTFILDFNKLLVPTPPVYARDSSGQWKIIEGKDPQSIPLLQGIFGSFSDAPGGFQEELREINISAGVEYWYNDLFAARLGTFQENKLKGNRKYLTTGFGLRYQRFGLDFAYLVSFRQNNPLGETLRFSLSFDLASKTEDSIVE